MKQTERIPLVEIWLDEENPRLKSLIVSLDQTALVKTLYSEMAVDEVAMSIAANGYFEVEPLLLLKDVPPRKGTTKSYTVIEGNRRVAALKLLTNKTLRETVKAHDLPELSAQQLKALKEIPALVYETRRELWQFLGFRHINGVKPWDAYSKAHYVADVHENYKISLEDIATDIGDRHTTVSRLYRGLTVLRQAEKWGFSREDIARSRFFFSHLYTATDQPEFQKFLAIDPKNIKSNPIPSAKKKELLEFMTWLYGSKTKNAQPVVRSQNPDLNYLREVIGTPPALAALRRGSTIERAHEISRGDTRRFSDAVYSALEELKEANGLFLAGFDPRSELLTESIEQIGMEASRLVAQSETRSKVKKTLVKS
jgi:hypothetical protein